MRYCNLPPQYEQRSLPTWAWAKRRLASVAWVRCFGSVMRH